MKQEYVTTLNVLMAANSLTNNANPIYGSKVEDAVYDFQFNNSQWVVRSEVILREKDGKTGMAQSCHEFWFDSFNLPGAYRAIPHSLHFLFYVKIHKYAILKSTNHSFLFCPE